MKIKNMTNQIVTRDFFKTTMDIIAESTSRSYSAVVIEGVKEQLGEEFKFSKSIRIIGKSIEVDETINSVGEIQLRKFFTKVVNMMGANYLKMLLAQKLDTKALNYLENLGLRFG
ncbi:MAG: hypothetical protein IH934_01120 [Nanoarchaeota archaeon]|nr:hypothetical protein [Nanoarchaeota archaeon]